MNKMMIDCETLGLGERPVILSIGAVVFDENQIFEYFQIDIDIENSKQHGFSVDQSTLDWWNEQDPIAKNMAFSGKEKIEFALQKLVGFYSLYGCDEIWSKGALADIRWINNALDHFGIERPWKYYKEFCFRTLLKSGPNFEIPFIGIQHNTLDDAIHQVKQFIHIKTIRNNQIKDLIKQGQIAIHQAKTIIDQGQRFNEMAQKLADLEFKLLQKDFTHG